MWIDWGNLFVCVWGFVFVGQYVLNNRCWSILVNMCCSIRVIPYVLDNMRRPIRVVAIGVVAIGVVAIRVVAIRVAPYASPHTRRPIRVVAIRVVAIRVVAIRVVAIRVVAIRVHT